jgi:GTP-binding protein
MRIVEATFMESAQSIMDSPSPDKAEVAFLGRSNVGKSSLLNTLTHRKGLAKSSSTPGKTQLINYFNIKFKTDKEEVPFLYARFVDLPGFGYARVSKSLKKDWNNNLTGYLEKRQCLQIFVHLIDARHIGLPIDRNVDEFTQQFLSENPAKGGFDSITSSGKYGNKIKLHKKTAIKNIAQAVTHIISDTIINADRFIHFTITPQRKVNRIELYTKNNLTFKTFGINGVGLAKKEDYDFVFRTGLKKSKRVLSHYIIGDDESLEVQFSIPKEEKLSLTLYEVSYDLLENSHFNMEPLYHIKPRSNTMMPTPFVANDAIIVKKQINF